jgi:hypothetical protein
MLRIYVRRKNEIAGHVFICKSSIKGDKVAILPFFGFVTDGLITEEEWDKSQQTIVEKFELCVTESYIDGRCKAARNAKKFNWKDVLKMKQGETFKPMAYKTLCNSFGIEIEVSNCGSMVRCRIGENGAVSDWKEIHFTKGGRPYFNYGKTRYYLDEFMRI